MIDHPSLFIATVFASSILAGVLGSLVGLGGGFVVVPVLTLFLKIPIQYAIGAGLVSAVCSSSFSSGRLLKSGVANLNIASFLEVATTAGALTGVFLSGFVPARVLSILFSGVIFYSGISMFRRRTSDSGRESALPSRLSLALNLGGSYYDPSSNRHVAYRAERPVLALIFMLIAGTLSALLGIGSGALKVPAMDRGMKLPIKVSSATSNLMIGVTTAGSALIYFIIGKIQPLVAVPVALGVLSGSFVGTRLLLRLKSEVVRAIFILILIGLGAQMFMKGLG